MKQLFIVVNIIISLACCTFTASAQPHADINWANGYIIATGQGVGKAGEHSGKARIKATTAAKVAAQRNLLEIIKGVRITSQTTVQDAMLVEDVIRTRIDGMLKGAYMVGEPFVEIADGAPVVTVTMKVCLNGMPKECASRPTLTNVLDLDARPVPPFVPKVMLVDPAPPSLPPEPVHEPSKHDGWKKPVYDSSKPVTGLVVHLNGRYFERELLPVVITQGKPDLVTVYSVKVVKPSVVRTFGAVRYVDSMDNLKNNQALGSNPIIVTADAVTKDNMIVIRSGDAKLIRETLAHGNDYLGDAKFVVLVR
jgi:hypothetical protein